MNDEMNTQPQSDGQADDQTNVPSTEEGTVTPEEVTPEMPEAEKNADQEGQGEETKTDEAPATE